MQEANALNFETCEWLVNVEIDLIPLKKFVQELLHRSRSTCSTLQTAICYMEAIQNKIKIAQDNNMAVTIFVVYKSTTTVGLSSTKLLSTIVISETKAIYLLILFLQN